jgi:uncharacterized protein YbcV (DUF1398 family)
MDHELVKGIAERSKRDRWPFPKTFEALKEAGVASYRFDVATGETKLLGNQGESLAEPLAGSEPVEIAPALNGAAVVAAIKRHMLERTPFLDFRREAAFAGVAHWEVDMRERTCTYFGRDGGTHVEQVPAVTP